MQGRGGELVIRTSNIRMQVPFTDAVAIHVAAAFMLMQTSGFEWAAIVTPSDFTRLLICSVPSSRDGNAMMGRWARVDSAHRPSEFSPVSMTHTVFGTSSNV